MFHSVKTYLNHLSRQFRLTREWILYFALSVVIQLVISLLFTPVCQKLCHPHTLTLDIDKLVLIVSKSCYNKPPRNGVFLVASWRCTCTDTHWHSLTPSDTWWHPDLSAWLHIQGFSEPSAGDAFFWVCHMEICFPILAFYLFYLALIIRKLWHICFVYSQL